MSNNIGFSPKTFTIGFGDDSFDERAHARKISEKFVTEHFEGILEKWDRSLLTNLILNHVGQPFADTSLLPTSFVSKLAAQHVKVALSGDGSDELFSGYQRYQARAILRWYTRLPKVLRKNAERYIRALPEPTLHHSSSLIKKSHLFQDIVDRHTEGSPYIAPTMYSQNEYNQLAPELLNLGHESPVLDPESTLEGIQEMMAKDVLIYLPHDILTKVDRASMSHSLEVRAPFLDKNLVEFSFSLSDNFHRSLFRGKKLLRNTFNDLLPKFVWDRRKQGFATPVHNWFQGKLSSEFEGLMNEYIGPISRRYVMQLLDSHKNKIRDNSYRLWALYIYMLWKDHDLVVSKS